MAGTRASSTAVVVAGARVLPTAMGATGVRVLPTTVVMAGARVLSTGVVTAGVLTAGVLTAVTGNCGPATLAQGFSATGAYVKFFADLLPSSYSVFPMLMGDEERTKL